MPTRNHITATGLETYRAVAASNVGQLFSKFIDLAVEEEDLFSLLEGDENSDRPVWIKTDLSKGGGDKVFFNTIASLGGDGVHGDEVLEGNEEALTIGSYSCQVDFIRHAAGLTKKDIEFLAAGRSIEAAAAPLVAKWLGRKRQRDLLMKFITSGVGLNTIRPNNKATRDDLTADDALSTGIIAQSNAIATSIGARPVNIMATGYSKVFEYLFLATEDSLAPLANSSSWLQAQQSAGTRGDENVLFRGGYTRWNGSTILHHKVVDADTPGPIGSPLLPKALLGDAVAAGTVAFAVTGGGRAASGAANKYFECFSGAPYRYLETDSVTSSDANTYYFVVVNVSGADKGKWGFYSYTGSANDGNKITVASRLGAAASGARVTTLGGVTWNAAKNTDVHPTGSVVLQANKNGVPIGYSVCMGAGAGLRAYGSLRHELVQNTSDYGHRMGWAYQSIYGQQVRRDSGITGSNQPRGYVLVEHAVTVANAPMN
ncbi:MAG: DUF4043 family protein [Verrucomicrobiota bacterium]